MTSWRTTLSSLIAAGFAFILFSPQYFAHIPWLVDLAKFATIGGLISLGINSKDVQVHSTVDEVGKATAAVNEKALDAANRA